MKIALIHGQNHKGSTYHVARKMAEKMPGDNEIVEFFLPKDLNSFCIGCGMCIQDRSICPFQMDKSKIMGAIEEAEILIFSTPTYCLRASAPMKSFIDLTFTYWMPHKPEKAMFSKKALVVSTAAGMGTRLAIRDIRLALTFWGVPYIKTYGIRVGALGWDSVSQEKKDQIERDTSRIAKEVYHKKARVSLKTKGLFYLMRSMYKNNKGASVKEKEYWEKQGWLGKQRPWKG